MKFTLSWLKTHLDTDAPVALIAETLTRIGLELEGIEDRGAALAAFRIARVIAAAPHPNADRLRVCTVDTGEGIVSVVCGAPNARTGMKSRVRGTGQRHSRHRRHASASARSAASSAPACCCLCARWGLARITPVSSICRRMRRSVFPMSPGPGSTIQ